MKTNALSATRFLAPIALAIPMLFGAGCPNTTTSTIIFNEAARRFQQQDANAVLFFAEGAHGTSDYRFRATDPAKATTVWELTYDGGQWTTSVVTGRVIGVKLADVRTGTMTLEEAEAVLLKQGYADNYFGWSLSAALNPSWPNPFYAFRYRTQTVNVDAVTGTVSVPSLGSESPPQVPPPGEDSVSLQMIAAAAARIQQENANAIIIYAGGQRADGQPMQTAAETDLWMFDAVALDETGVAAWKLRYDGEWTVEAAPWPPLDLAYVDLTKEIPMDVVEAWNLGADAGFGPPYTWWCTFRPLNASVPNAVYVSQAAAERVVVDVITHAVTTE